MTVIETAGLTKRYGKNRGIIDVNITVDEGEIFGFIGPNGAGKSTMIRTLLNFIYPTAGQARILGMDCVRESHKIKRQTGYVPSEVHFYDDITVSQLLKYSLSFYNHADKEYADSLAGRFELETYKKIGQLSSGNNKKTALVVALSISPKLLILDEPTSGLDPLMQKTFFEALREQQNRGNTVFLSSHNLDEVQSLCDRVAIIREGRIADIQRLDELKARQEKRITVFAESLPEDFAKDAGFHVVSRNGTNIVFTYGGSDINRVVSELAKLNLKNFTVEDARLSDIFMSYYGQGR
jgi:ABC-2 type transport system ATP-binding protein